MRGPLIIGRGEWLLLNRPRADTNDGSWPDTGPDTGNRIQRTENPGVGGSIPPPVGSGEGVHSDHMVAISFLAHG